MLKNRKKIHKFTLTMFRNIPGTTATYENCPTILARNYKNDDKTFYWSLSSLNQ